MRAEWLCVDDLGNGVLRLSEPLGAVAPRFGVAVVNLYLVLGGVRACLIDTGTGISAPYDPSLPGGPPTGELSRCVSGLLGGRELVVACTHSHWDHVGGNAQFPEVHMAAGELEAARRGYEMPIFRSELRAYRPNPARDRPPLPAGFGPERFAIRPAPSLQPLYAGDALHLGRRRLTVYDTPGHSPGHITLFDSSTGLAFCADTCYAGTMWLHTAQANLAAWAASLELLAALPGVTGLCGGHGEPPAPPGLALQVRRALDLALAGRSRQTVWPHAPGVRKHRFDGFSILLREGASL